MSSYPVLFIQLILYSFFPFLLSFRWIIFGFSYFGFPILVLKIIFLEFFGGFPENHMAYPLAYLTGLIISNFYYSPDKAMTSVHFQSIYIPPSLNVVFVLYFHLIFQPYNAFYVVNVHLQLCIYLPFLLDYIHSCTLSFPSEITFLLLEKYLCLGQDASWKIFSILVCLKILSHIHS